MFAPDTHDSTLATPPLGPGLPGWNLPERPLREPDGTWPERPDCGTPGVPWRPGSWDLPDRPATPTSRGWHMPLVSGLAAAVVLLAAVAVPTPASADPTRGYRSSPVSLGVGFGDPTALDLKIWTGDGSGVDLGIGFTRFSERIGIYAEYELGLFDFWIEDAIKGVFYLGIGGAVALRHRSDDLSVALIVPIGLNFRFHAPVEIFVEARPGFALLDDSGFGIGGQLGVRFVF